MSHPEIDQYISFIYTNDLATSALFYEEVLGLQLWRDQGTCRIYHLIGESYLGVCQTSPNSKGVVTSKKFDNIILTLVTADVDGWYSYLRNKGVMCEHTPHHNAKYNIYHFFLRDPDGYLIEIQRFLDEQTR